MSVACPHCLGSPPSLPPGAADWLKTGERGLSSEAIFSHLTGIPISGPYLSTPADPCDFRRCQKLFAAVPDFAARLGEMAAVSPAWALLVAHWTEIAALMPKPDVAYCLMRELHAKARLR